MMIGTRLDLLVEKVYDMTLILLILTVHTRVFRADQVDVNVPIPLRISML